MTSETTPSPELDTLPLTSQERVEALTLLGTVFLIAACGLIYELLIASISSYLLGSSITQFSLCIGAFIGAMGVGSYLSQYVTRGLLRAFLAIEIALGVVGGISAWALFLAYATGGYGYQIVLYALLGIIGGLTGLELPLLTRLLHRYGGLRTIIAQALSFDYIGALLGSIAFPLFLLPTLGTTRTAFLIGSLNILVAAYNLWVFRGAMRAPGPPLALCGLIAVAQAAGFVGSGHAMSQFERGLYEDEIVYSKQTPYQRIVLTRWKDDLRLYLDGNLQFASVDEYRYHEALVHPALGLAPFAEEVLVLGGGDGLAVREILKHKSVKRVVVVDIDPAITRLAKTYPAIKALNGGVMNDPRVKLVHQDAYKFLEDGDAGHLYGVLLADLPDPNAEGLAKLYSREFYRLARRRLAKGGVFVTQATSPFFSRKAFWCVEATMNAAGFKTAPYHAYIPSFGDWGFVMAGAEGVPPISKVKVDVPTRFLNPETLASMAHFDGDTQRVPVNVSTLDHPMILNYYEKGTSRWE